MMQIDWITVGAQIVNFLVLVWLLQRFLYGPVIRAMDRREQRIAERLNDAEQKKLDAEREAQAYREQREQLEQQRAGLLAEAQASAEQEKKLLETALRQDVEQQRREWLRQLDARRNAFLKDVRDRATEHFYGLARRALGDLANARLEDQLAAVFIDRVGGLDGETRQKVRAACIAAGNTVAVHTRFPLSPARRRQITAAIREVIAGDAAVAYEENGAAGYGIALKAGSQIVSWSLDSYLDSLEQAVGEELSAMAEIPSEPAAS